jgi:hypothetical protein
VVDVLIQSAVRCVHDMERNTWNTSVAIAVQLQFIFGTIITNVTLLIMNCCSFGTTHFCTGCHDEFSRLMALPRDRLAQCPVGPHCIQLEGDTCPLRVQHPPTGDECALGCAICRNISTF